MSVLQRLLGDCVVMKSVNNHHLLLGCKYISLNNKLSTLMKNKSLHQVKSLKDIKEPNSQHSLNYVTQTNLHSHCYTGMYLNIIPGTHLKEHGIEEREI